MDFEAYNPQSETSDFWLLVQTELTKLIQKTGSGSKRLILAMLSGSRCKAPVFYLLCGL